jgi:hypothetical protein
MSSDPSHVFARQRDWKPASDRFDSGGIRGGDRRRIDFIPIREQDDNRGAREQPQPALNDGVEHRLRVAERIADDAEYPGGRCLLLQRFAHIIRALSQLI